MIHLLHSTSFPLQSTALLDSLAIHASGDFVDTILAHAGFSNFGQLCKCASIAGALRTAMSVCRQAEAVDMARFADHLANSYIPNTVIIDATASEVPPALYLQWMQKGIHIITPNKKLGSGPLDQYLALRHFQRESYIHFFYEVSILGTPEGRPPQRVGLYTSCSGFSLISAERLSLCLSIFYGVSIFLLPSV